jgi:hypothetical protein
MYIGTPTACRRTVSGTISLPCSGCFSPFPHGTGSLSVSQEYLALPDGPGRFRQDSSCPALLRILLVSLIFTCTGLSPSMIKLSSLFHFLLMSRFAVLQPHICRNIYGLGCSPFARHYLGNHSCFLLLWVLRCFSSPRLLSGYPEYTGFTCMGCPIRISAD